MKDKIISITISTMIIILSILFLVFKKQDFSYNENRYLSNFPKYSFEELKNGNYLNGIDNYLGDHFPFRDNFMNIKTESLLLLNYKEINDVYISDKYLINKYETPKNTDKLINKLNDFYNDLDVDMSLMLVPTSISVYDEYLPSFAYNEQINTMNYIYDNIKFKTINVYDILKKNKNKYQLFYYLDHHWTTYGAYYAYKKYAIENNIDYYDINEFIIEKVTDDFMGTSYSKVLKLNNKKDEIYKFKLNNVSYKVKYNEFIKNSLYEESYLDKKDKYSYFLNNNNPIIEIESSINNNDTLLIIKDSFANCFIPFLANHYKKIIVIDPRYYKLSIKNYINSNSIDKVLILYNMNTIDSDNGIYTID